MAVRLVGLLTLILALFLAMESEAFAVTVTVDPDPVIAGEDLTMTLTAVEPGCVFSLADDPTWLLYDGATIIATATPVADDTSMSATFAVPETVAIGSILVFVPEDVISTPECDVKKSIVEVGRAVAAPAVSVVPLVTIMAAAGLVLLAYGRLRSPERRS